MASISIEVFFLDTSYLLKKLLDFLEVVDKSLNLEENRAWQNSDEGLRESFYWEDKKFDFEYFWPTAKNYSFITLLHLTIEERLRQLCMIVQAIDEELYSLDLGDSITSYMGFLEKSKMLPVKRIELVTWQGITDFEKVRNCIVHAYGRVEYVREKDKKRLQELINKDKNLLVESRETQPNQLMPSFDYCRNAVVTAEMFFKEIHEQYSKE